MTTGESTPPRKARALIAFSDWARLVVQQTRGTPSTGRRIAMNDDSSKEFDRITDLGKARSDEYTERLLAFVQDMEASGPEPFIPLLAETVSGGMARPVCMSLSRDDQD